MAARSYQAHKTAANKLIDACQEVDGEIHSYQEYGADPMSYACIGKDPSSQEPLYEVCNEIDGYYERMKGANWFASCEQPGFRYPYEQGD